MSSRILPILDLVWRNGCIRPLRRFDSTSLPPVIHQIEAFVARYPFYTEEGALNTYVGSAGAYNDVGSTFGPTCSTWKYETAFRNLRSTISCTMTTLSNCPARPVVL